MSKRDERRQRRQSQMRQRQFLLIGAVVLVAVAIVAWIIYENNKPIGPITAIPTQTYAQATGWVQGGVVRLPG